MPQWPQPLQSGISFEGLKVIFLLCIDAHSTATQRIGDILSLNMCHSDSMCVMQDLANTGWGLPEVRRHFAIVFIVSRQPPAL